MLYHFRPRNSWVLLVTIFILCNLHCVNVLAGNHNNVVENTDSLVLEAKMKLFYNPTEALLELDSLGKFAYDNCLLPLYFKVKKAELIYYQLNYQIEDWYKHLKEIDYAIELNKKYINYDSLCQKNNHEWGIYFYEIGFYGKSKNYLEAYIQFLNEFTIDTIGCINKYSAQQYLVEIYKKIGAFDVALQTALESLESLKCSSNDVESIDFSYAYFKIAHLYQKNRKNSESKRYYDLGKEHLQRRSKSTFKDHRSILIAHCNLADYSMNNNMLNDASKYLDEAEVYFNLEDVYTIRLYRLKGDLYFLQKETKKALHNYLFARNAYQKLQGTNSLELGIVHRKLGDVYQQMGETDQAVAYYNASIRSLVFDFDPGTDSETSFPFDRMLSSLELMQTLDAKAGLLLEQYGQTGDEQLLREAEKSTSLAITIFNQSRFDLVQQEDRQRQLALTYPLHEKAIQVQQWLYKESPDEQTIDKLLNLMGQSKGLGVSEMANHLLANDQRFADIFEEERQWKTQIANVEKTIFNKLSEGADPVTYQDLLDQEKQLKYDFIRWNQDVQKNHPDYFALKLSQDSVSVDKIRKEILEPDQGLIEYFWGEDYLFAIYLSQDQVGVQRLELSGIRDTLNQFLNLLNDEYSRESRSVQSRLQQLSFRLYQSLLAKPLAEMGPSIDQLIIIRDGLLGSLPFELLTQKMANHGFYQPDQFLIQDYIVSYGYSLPMLFKQKQLGFTRSPEKATFAGFAPTYEMPKSNSDSSSVLAYLTRSGYLPLPGAKKEVSTIRKLIGGTFFKDRSASEAQFKAKAGRYDLLHLAMHAVPDNQDPQFSSLIFSLEEDGTSEDGYLQAIEIYNMQLRASMVVLSACNTGYGEWKRGEGIMSLGHAFTYAGVPSTVHSHWKVPDEATAEIMKLFYQNLKEHQRKDEALANAKRALLAQRPEWSHPVFWAGFVAVGDMEPLDLASKNTLFTSPVSYAVLILVLISLLLIRNKAFRQK